MEGNGSERYMHLALMIYSGIKKVKSLSRVRLFATPWTVAYQAPPSMGFSLHGILQARILEWVAISFFQCMKVKSESEVAQSCPTPRPHGLQPTRLLHPWDFPGKSTGVGCHCLLRRNSLLFAKFLNFTSGQRAFPRGLCF